MVGPGAGRLAGGTGHHGATLALVLATPVIAWPIWFLPARSAGLSPADRNALVGARLRIFSSADHQGLALHRTGAKVRAARATPGRRT